eukprot:753953-Hanusia_phi.AAC.2
MEQVPGVEHRLTPRQRVVECLSDRESACHRPYMQRSPRRCTSGQGCMKADGGSCISIHQ